MQEKLSDEALLLFSTDVLVANVPSLVSDLGSAKYALLSFSEKSRKEVKQKSALLPEVSAALRDLLDVREQIQNKQKELSQLEAQLVSLAPTQFVSAEEQANASATPVESNTLTESHDNTVDEPSCSEDSLTHPVNYPSVGNNGTKPLHKDDGHHPVVVLPPEELKVVREVEARCEAEREELIRRSKETNKLEIQFDVDRANCEEMTGKVQSLKWKYEKIRRELQSVKLERTFHELLRSEHTARRAIRREGLDGLRALFASSRSDEEAILSDFLSELQANVAKVTRELDDRRAAHEIDLAVYQIAYKDQQAAADALTDDVAHLRRRALELAVRAREQEVEEARHHCVRRLVLASLKMTEEAAVRLTAEQRAEVAAEHSHVCATAARIGLMEEQKRPVAAALMHVTATEDGAQVLSALKQAQAILRKDITLEES